MIPASSISRLVTLAKGAPGLYASMGVGAGVGIAGALQAGPEGTFLGHRREFWTGVVAGVGAIATAKTGAALGHALAPAFARELQAVAGSAGRRLVATHPFNHLHAAWDAASPLQRGTAVLVASSLPSIAMLRATDDHRTVLGQGHDFWSGAVWGVAGLGLVKGAQKLHNLPLAVGWVGGDFAALGVDAVS